MHFTREPIIETIITPKDGYKLVLRPSKGGSEEFFVDMVEVISFGNTSFYRSLEKPKCFVVPTQDYDVIEVREARMALKSSSVEKVKIAGGKKEDEEKGEKKGRNKRTRKKKDGKPKDERKPEESGEEPRVELEPKLEPKPLEKRALIPPPPTLISETIARYKEEEAAVEEDVPQ
ncbi:MAG: hypothetical protein H7A36_04230 [Chlamydiales bacterium]|nr:hypothetical protein [Chlamydiales bacterium]